MAVLKAFQAAGDTFKEQTRAFREQTNVLKLLQAEQNQTRRDLESKQTARSAGDKDHAKLLTKMLEAGITKTFVEKDITVLSLGYFVSKVQATVTESTGWQASVLLTIIRVMKVPQAAEIWQDVTANKGKPISSCLYEWCSKILPQRETMTGGEHSLGNHLERAWLELKWVNARRYRRGIKYLLALWDKQPAPSTRPDATRLIAQAIKAFEEQAGMPNQSVRMNCMRTLTVTAALREKKYSWSDH